MSLSLARSGRALGVVAAVTAAFMAVSTTPAAASSMFFSKSSGRMASASWLEVGTLPGGVPGNIHFGDMWVEELSRGSANVFGVVNDITCPAGVIPARPGGGHWEEEEGGLDPRCTDEGYRFIDGGNVTFTMDRKFRKATLTGTLNVVGGHGGDPEAPPSAPATPRVDMTWTGVGDTYTSVNSGRGSDGTSTWSYRYSFSGRDAVISGRIGAMIFDDHPAEWSFGQMGSYKSADRYRTR